MTNIKPGETANYQGSEIKIRQLIDLNTVLVEHLDNGTVMRVKVRDLISVNVSNKKEGNKSKKSVLRYSQRDWELAKKKYEIIKPALDAPGNGEIITKIVEKSRKNKATIYRWIEKYQQAGNIISLIEGRGHATKGKTRIPPDVEEIIKEGVEKIYLKKGERKKINKVIEYVQSTCSKLKLGAPHPNSIRARIKKLDDFRVTEARFGRKVAKQKYEANRGKFPDGNSALEVVQIDHTELDIILVDPVYREPIGRPWITTAIDVCTRMLVGFYLSFDKPSFVSLGQCISNSVLPKHNLLKNLEIDGNWPCWGFMMTIHCDNGKEFHSKSFERACDLHNININWRPKGTPHWGGHVESFNKTLAQEIHNLPGSTFSNTIERAKYPSEKKATLTFDEFEKWLVTFIVNVYHQKKHSELLKPPIVKWEEELVGSSEKPGIGYPNFPDEVKTRIDFMPIFYRTIQEYGVANQSINYYSDVLKKWIHKNDRGSGKANLPLKHEFRWDFRDLSSIYFYDQELEQYFQIPYRNLAHPTINIWELKAIKKKLRDLGEKLIDESRIFKALDEMNTIEESAISEKKKIRVERNKARRANSEKSAKGPTKNAKITTTVFDEIELKNIKPFE